VPAGPARNRAPGRLKGSAGTIIRLSCAAFGPGSGCNARSVRRCESSGEPKKPRGAPRGEPVSARMRVPRSRRGRRQDLLAVSALRPLWGNGKKREGAARRSVDPGCGALGSRGLFNIVKKVSGQRRRTAGAASYNLLSASAVAAGSPQVGSSEPSPQLRGR
jgi:hypothetical protein